MKAKFIAGLILMTALTVSAPVGALHTVVNSNDSSGVASSIIIIPLE